MKKKNIKKKNILINDKINKQTKNEMNEITSIIAFS